MKSSFGRSFTTAALILLVALTILGTSFQRLVRDYLTNTTFDSLERNAKVISHLASSYAIDGSLSNREFLLNLDVASNLSESDIVICNTEGRVVICSDSPFGCHHQKLKINPDYLEKVLEQGSDRATGLIKGLYRDSRFIVAAAIADESQESPVGIVVVSIPTASINTVIGRISNYFVSTAIVVVFLSIVAVSAFVGRESKPLRDMARAANAFGHGDLEARVRLDDHYSDEVRDLAIAFNNMASSLQKSEYQRQEFVANVSHELKTPMTTISGYVDGILDGTIPESRREHYLHIIP